MSAWLIIGVAGLAALLGVSVYAHHTGYVAGQAERTAHYEPLFNAALAAKQKADDRALAVEQAARAIALKMEADHVAEKEFLAGRVTAANARIVDLLRQHAVSTAPSCGAMPSTGGAAGVPAGAAASDARIGRIAGEFAGVGGRCEHDAAAVAGWQEYWRKQQALMATAAPSR